MITTLHVCPRCEAFVQPDWPSCKICGFDPRHGDQHPERVSFVPRKRSRERMSFLQVIAALVTLTVLAIAVFGVVVGGVYLWNHRDSHARQEFVAFEK